MLIITKLPLAHLPEAEQAALAGKNRFECRTCPYQMVLDKRYFERKLMPMKAAEDVLGGKDAWVSLVPPSRFIYHIHLFKHLSIYVFTYLPHSPPLVYPPPPK